MDFNSILKQQGVVTGAASGANDFNSLMKASSGSPPAPPQQSFLQKAGNIAKNIGSFVFGSNPMTNPSVGINTLIGAGKEATQEVQNVGQMGLKATDALGITKDAGQSTFFQDPNALKPKGAVQTMAGIGTQVAPYLTGVGEGMAAKSAADFAIGTAQTGNPITGALISAGGLVAEGVGKLISKTGEALYKAVIPTSKEEAKMLQAYMAKVPFFDRVFGTTTAKAPTTAAGVSFDKNLLGTETMLGVQGKRAATNLWNNLLSPQLDGYKGKIDMNSFFSDAEKQIIKDNPEISRQKGLLEALQSFKDDYADVKDVSLKELQKFKEGWAKFIPEKAYQGKPISGMANDVKDILAGQARTKIYNALGEDVKQAYLDYGNLKAIQELGQNAMVGVKTMSGSIWNIIKDKAMTPVATVGGMTVYKVGQGITFLGAAGAKVVSDIFSPTTSSPQSSEQVTTPPKVQK